MRIRHWQSRDKQQILAFFTEADGPDRSTRMERLWRWQWDTDPRRTEGGYCGVVAEVNGRLVGSVGLMPAGLFVNGRPVEAWWQVNSMVHPDHRRRGIIGKLIEHGAADTMMLAKNTSGPMLAARQKNGFRILNPSGYWIRMLSYTQLIARATGSFVAPAVAPVANAIIPNCPRPSREVTLLGGDFDDRFDALWEDARQGYPAITLRDARTLNWRYRQRPDTDYTVLMLDDGSSLRGYAVVRTFLRRRRLRGKILDLLTRPDDDRTRHDLLAASLAALRDRRADSVYCYATHRPMIAALQAAGFVPKRRPDPMTVRGPMPNDPYVTEGDGDGN